MNKREQKKQETRNAIFEAAKEEFINNGFLNTNTKTIADRAGVAHGTLFLHFNTKNNLIEKVFEEKFISVNNQLEKILGDKGDIESLLLGYLNFLQKNESFFEVLAKELPYYPQDIRVRVFLKEASARNYFYKCIQKGIADGIYKDVDIKMSLTFLFGTISYFLVNKQNIIKNGSIIGNKRDSIIVTFIKFITT